MKLAILGAGSVGEVRGSSLGKSRGVLECGMSMHPVQTLKSARTTQAQPWPRQQSKRGGCPDRDKGYCTWYLQPLVIWTQRKILAIAPILVGIQLDAVIRDNQAVNRSCSLVPRCKVKIFEIKLVGNNSNMARNCHCPVLCREILPTSSKYL